MIVLDLSILNQKGTPMFNSDTFANRPAFGIVGRIFISTDTKEFYRDTGTSWELIGGPGSGTITGSGAATQVAFWNGASTITGSNNLFWDSTNNYLGISTNTPTTALDVHHSTNSGAIFNQTTATNNNTINFQTSGSGRWRIGNFYTAGADDFGIFDVVGTLQQLTIVKTTGQTFIGAKTTASGRLVVNSATADAHLQVVGANSPSIRIDNAGSGGTQRFVFGLATATNNFIQGATAGEFCISTQSAGNMLFGMWQTINASEVMRITTANNLVIGSTFDNGQKLQVTGTAYISGNVGIGISAPLTFRASVYLNGAGIQNTLELNNIHQTVGVVDGVRLKIREFNIESSSTFGSTNNILTFGHSTNKQLTLTEAGDLGLGTTSSFTVGGTAKLSILGSSVLASMGSSNNDLLYIRREGTAIYSFQSTSNGGSSGRIQLEPFGGNVLVGTTTDNGARLQITGTSTFSQDIEISGSTGSLYSSAQLGFTKTASGGQFGIYTLGTGTPTMYFDHRGTGNTGRWEWRSGTGGGTTAMTLSDVGAAVFNGSIAINNSVAAAVAAPSTHKVAILIGGVQYYLLASNV
jgi:hypothetical protein